MTQGLDDRSRNNDGQIRRKRNDTLADTLAPRYPEFEGLPRGTTLGDLENRFGTNSLDETLRALRDTKR